MKIKAGCLYYDNYENMIYEIVSIIDLSFIFLVKINFKNESKWFQCKNIDLIDGISLLGEL